MGDKTGAYADHLAAGGGLIHQRHNSWGRTRSPKSLVHSNGTAITALADTSTLVGITASTAGYLTENQMYMHLLIEETNDGGNTNASATTVYGYCHAFQRWFELQQSQAAGYGANTEPTAATIDPPNSSTTPANHVPSAREYRAYEIIGIDRVAFVNANAGRVNILAACSTF